MPSLNPSALSHLQPTGVAPAYGAGFPYPCAMFDTTSQAASALAADLLVATPFYCRENVTMTAISAYQHTAGAGVNGKLGVYSNSGGRPLTLLADSGTVSFPASTGWRTGTISLAMSPGWYWLACVFDGSANVMMLDPSLLEAQYKFLSDFGAMTGVAGTTAALANAIGFYGTHVFAALPASFPSITGYGGVQNVPVLWLGK